MIAVGIIYPKVNFQLTTSLIFMLASLFTFLVPFARTLLFLLTLFAVNGICLGFFEAGASVFMLQLWGKEAANFIQALQLMYGAGSLIAPMIAQPFLVTMDLDSVNVNGTEVETFHPERTELIYPFSILAGFMAFNAVSTLVIWIAHPETPDHPSRDLDNYSISSEQSQDIGEVTKETEAEVSVEMEGPQSSEGLSQHYNRWKILTIACVVMFMHVYFGLQVSFGSYLMTFAVHCDMRLSKTTGAYLTTLYWTMFSVTKLGAIFFVRRIGHQISILMSLAVMMTGAALLLPLGNRDAVSLWIGVALEGIGISSIFGCIFGHMEEYFQVTDLIASLIAMSSVLGELSFPLLISHFIEADPQILMMVLFISTCILTSLFIAVIAMCRRKLTVKPPSA